MATAHITWTDQDTPGFPGGTVADHILVSVGGTPADIQVAVDALAADFVDIPPGTYTATVSLISSTGAVLGTPASSAPFDITPATVTLHVPVGVGESTV